MIEFYATVSWGKVRSYMPGDVAYMLPASSWARNNLSAPRLPPHIKHVAADSGGFVASRIWGDYRYSHEQYVSWLSTFNPSWAATMDYCCENEITTGKTGVIRERQDKTTENARLFWDHYRDVPWKWVPTVQGWDAEDYRRHAKELRPLIREMQAHYRGDLSWRVGIGTLCARGQNETIRNIICTVQDELPGTPLHLWGVKLSFFKARIAIPSQVVSVDSAAWSPGGLGRTGHEAREEYIRLGLTQRQYDFMVALPRYLEKFRRAVESPKQIPLALP